MKKVSGYRFQVTVTALVVLLLSLPLLVHAIGADGSSSCTNGFCPLVNVSGSSKLGQLYADSNPGDLTSFINTLFKFMLAVGAIAAVLRIAYAGYLYMGSDLWSNKGEAKAILGDVTLGILLLLGIYLILYEINPDIVKLKALNTIQNNPVQQANAGLQASQNLQQQHIGDNTTDPSSYMPSLSMQPIPGYYCFPKALTSGSGYSCVTSQTNCTTLAQAEGKTCTSY